MAPPVMAARPGTASQALVVPQVPLDAESRTYTRRWLTGRQQCLKGGAMQHTDAGHGEAEVPAGTPVEDDEQGLDIAIGQARIGLAEGGVPIGAALVVDGKLVASGRNRRVQWGSAIRHG